MSASITPGQKKQYLRFVEDAAEKALASVDIDKDGLQKLFGRGDEFQSDIIDSLRKHAVSNQFADEEVASSYGYLSGYTPKSVAEQVKRLRELFPKLGTANEQLAEQPLPPHAEGYFAIPRWEKIASTYNAAVEKILAVLSETRNGKFHNYRKGQLGPDRLRQHVRTVTMLQTLGDQQQGHDILVVPSQFGLRHRGRSVRRAREVLTANEFGLGAFAIGSMLLTHPERLQNVNDLWVDCPGDEYHDPVGDRPFSRAPCFGFSDGRLAFVVFWFYKSRGRYGSVSGFLPQ